MICRQCGTEIADKAIVCYRCGAGTADPVRKPAEVRPRRGRILPLVALVVLALLGLFLGQAGGTVVPDSYRLGATFGIVLAMVLLVVRLIRRR